MLLKVISMLLKANYNVDKLKKRPKEKSNGEEVQGRDRKLGVELKKGKIIFMFFHQIVYLKWVCQ